MYLTEEQAKEKICPMIYAKAGFFCVATGCMMFRQAEPYRQCANCGARMGKDYKLATCVSCDNMDLQDKQVGFCGLAGKP